MLGEEGGYAVYVPGVDFEDGGVLWVGRRGRLMLRLRVGVW